MSQENSGKIPDWLKEVQNNSYMPELLISGAVLFTLFSFDKHIINFVWSMRESFSFAGFNILMSGLTVSLFASHTALKIILLERCQ